MHKQAPDEVPRLSPPRWFALGALLVGALLPACAGTEAFPHWDLDPTRTWTPVTGITPPLSVAFAALSMIGASVALACHAREAGRLPRAEVVLASIGSGGILAHALAAPVLHEGSPDGLEHIVRSAHWLALVWGGVGIAPLARDPRARATVLALLAGFLVPMLAKALLQILVEFPATRASFERTKDAVFESKGWLPASPSALAYERRLIQPDASAWFGLSNVYASFVAAGTAGLCAAIASTLARTRRVTLGLLAAFGVLLASVAGLLLTRSKGGIGAGAIAVVAAGGLAVIASLRPAWRNRVARAFGPAVILMVLGAIALRGALWTDLGERSLLFRAFYAIGSLRIWRDAPLFGVGPDGFQSAYALAKVPIATETVQSPHSVLFDWTATLGAFGLAWAVWLFWHASRLAPPAPTEINRESFPVPGRDSIRFVAIVIAGCSLGGAWIERGLATPEFAIARVLGLAGWLGASILLLRFMRTRAGAWFAGASGLALVAHAQIEVTPIWTNAAPLFGLWFGAVSAGHPRVIPEPEHDAGARKPIRSVAPALVPATLAVWLLVGPVWSLARWEASLREASMIVRPGAIYREAFSAAMRSQDRAALERLAGELSATTGRSVPARPRELAGVIETIAVDRLAPAAQALERAIAARPAHAGTHSARGRLLLEIGALHPDEALAAQSAVEAAREATGALAIAGGRPAFFDWAGVSATQAADILVSRMNRDRDDPTVRELRGFALSAWLNLAARTPLAVRPAVRLMDLYAEQGPPEEAGFWAARVLELDALTGLDPIAGLTDAERARAEALLIE